jgi:hypothetical protein
MKKDDSSPLFTVQHSFHVRRSAMFGETGYSERGDSGVVRAFAPGI